MKNIIKTVLLVVTIPLLLLTVLYGGGVIAQFISGYISGVPEDAQNNSMRVLYHKIWY